MAKYDEDDDDGFDSFYDEEDEDNGFGFEDEFDQEDVEDGFSVSDYQAEEIYESLIDDLTQEQLEELYRKIGDYLSG